ncbi:MAG TPA: hypothetical protein VF843_00580 [Streptosporangiaceae bacterium]
MAADRPPLPASAAGLVFAGEMYAVQLDQLAVLTGASRRGAAKLAARWRAARLAESGPLSQGPRWVWLTRAGLATAGLPYTAAPPGLSRLAHLRAVTAARLALSAAPGFAVAGGYWRSERRLRARMGGRIGLREHVPDAEVHWPGGTGAAWAGECWAIEVELTPKTPARTIAIMREILLRTGDYGCLAADAAVPGRPPRHDRAVYVCSPTARTVVSRAREALGPLAARIEIRLLPAGATLGEAAWPDRP